MYRKISKLPNQVAVVLAALTCASSLVSATEPQVVVLNNGNIFEGRVQFDRNSDRYIVTKGPWYTIHVPRDTVDFVARNPRHAYAIKKKRISPNHVGQHVRLAQWCMRNDFEYLAAETLVHIIRLDPHHSSIDALEQQLMSRAQPKPESNSGTVQPVSYHHAQAASTESELPPLPPNSVAHFTRAIQPLLMNRCGQAACHGNASTNDLRLWEQRNGRIPKALTWKNLRSVLQQVDHDSPNDSPILLRALTAHGPAKRPPFEPHETKQFQRLQHWVVEATLGESATAQVVTEPVSFAGHTEGIAPAQGMSEALARLYRESGAEVPAAHSATQAGGFEAAASANSGDVELAGQDPFDPAEFNARGDQ